MKIGELAKKTGLSVRTLHHYDEINLLNPSDRTEAGHRDYSKSDVVRLHRIMALRKLGLSLQEVAKLIGETKASLQNLFDRKIETLRGEIAEKQETLELLEGANEYLELKDDVDVEEITVIIREFEMHQEYFTKDQLNDMKDRQDELGRDALKAALDEWPKLIEKVRVFMQKNTDPGDPEVIEVAKRWLELKDMFTGGCKDIESRTQKMYRENPEMAERFGVHGGMFEYVQKAADIMRSKATDQ